MYVCVSGDKKCQVFSENGYCRGSSIKDARRIFRKTNISNPPDMDTYVCVSGG